MALDNTAKMNDIVSALQEVTGINQKSNLKAALIKKGVTVKDTDSIGTMVDYVDKKVCDYQKNQLVDTKNLLSTNGFILDKILPITDGFVLTTYEDYNDNYFSLNPADVNGALRGAGYVIYNSSILEIVSSNSALILLGIYGNYYFVSTTGYTSSIVKAYDLITNNLVWQYSFYDTFGSSFSINGGFIYNGYLYILSNSSSTTYYQMSTDGTLVSRERVNDPRPILPNKSFTINQVGYFKVELVNSTYYINKYDSNNNNIGSVALSTGGMNISDWKIRDIGGGILSIVLIDTMYTSSVALVNIKYTDMTIIYQVVVYGKYIGYNEITDCNVIFTKSLTNGTQVDQLSYYKVSTGLLYSQNKSDTTNGIRSLSGNIFIDKVFKNNNFLLGTSRSAYSLEKGLYVFKKFINII